MGEHKIKRLVIFDLRKDLEAQDKKPLIDGRVTEESIESKRGRVMLTLDTGYMVILHLEKS